MSRLGSWLPSLCIVGDDVQGPGEEAVSVRVPSGSEKLFVNDAVFLIFNKK